MGGVRSALAAALTGLVAAAALVVPATPAAAHGIGGREPTNLRVAVVAVEGAPGVEVELVDLGRGVVLRNHGPDEVMVLGYDGEPYLRVGPDGVFENRRSPAVFHNRTLEPAGDPPATYDAAAEPEWREVRDVPVARFHDHRAHWMSDDPPAGVVPWEIPLRVAGRPAVVRGEFEAIAAPAAWPWLLLGVALAGAVAVAAHRWWRAAVAGALGAAVVAEVVHVVGAWEHVASSLGSRLGANVISLAAIGLGVLALRRVATGSPFSAAPVALFTGVVLVVAGIGDLLVFSRSQLPTDLAPGVARLVVAVAMGAGAGLVVAAVGRLRPTPVSEIAAPPA
jgi:hypothetical protein